MTMTTRPLLPPVLRFGASSALLLALLGCGDEARPPENMGGGRSYGAKPPPTARVTHPASAPLAPVTGDVAFLDNTRALGVTDRGLVAFDVLGEDRGAALPGFAPWALTSTGAGPAASALAVVPGGKLGTGPWALFLPTGRPQVGAVEVARGAAMGPLVGEGVLAAPLFSAYPSGLALPDAGPAASAAWVVDAVFGPGSVVRAYEWASWDPGAQTLTEKPGRRFTPPPEDFDGDGAADPTALGKLVFAELERAGLVSFSFLAPGPAGAAGGVYAFDPDTGDPLGHLVLPVSSTVAGALEFVGSVRVTRDHLYVVSAVKSADYADLGGRFAAYRVRSWRPFEVEDADPGAPYDQPETLLSTRRPNPVGLEVVGNAAYVVDAPFFAPASLDVIDLRARPVLHQSVELGELYLAGFSVPGDPRVSPDGSQLLIGAEAGLIRVELSSTP